MDDMLFLLCNIVAVTRTCEAKCINQSCKPSVYLGYVCDSWDANNSSTTQTQNWKYEHVKF